MDTNEEMLVSAFQEKVAIRFLLIWQICSAMSANNLINFWDQTISNNYGRLGAILNFVILTQLKKCKMTGP